MKNLSFIFLIALLWNSICFSQTTPSTEKIIDQINTANTAVKSLVPQCPSCELGSQGPPIDNFCIDPYRLICDPGKNPFVAAKIKAEQSYDKLVMSTASEKKISDELYTRQREDKTRKLFEVAKEMYVSYLTKEAKILTAEKQTAKLEIIDKMKQKLRKMQLQFGSSSGVSQFSAEYNSDVLSIGGMVLFADEMPEGLLSVILHEIGHALGPYEKEYKEGKKPSYPFDVQRSCLSQEHSLGAKTSDIECLKKFIANEGTKARNSDKLLLIEVEKNPDQAYMMPPGCQPGQFDEAYADWLATEVFWSAQSGQAKATGTSSLQEGITRFPRVLETASMSCKFGGRGQGLRSRDADVNTAMHAAAKARMNRMFFAHPKANQLFGCPPSHVEFFQKNQDYQQKPLKPLQKLYCGRPTGVP